MSFESTAIVMNHSKATGAARLVLWGIASHDGDGGSYPAMASLARYANINVRNTRIAVRRLEELGEIRTVTNGGALPGRPGIYQPNRYEILVRCPYFCDGTKHHRDSRKPLFSEDAGDLSSAVAGDLSSAVADCIPGGSLATSELSFNQPQQLKRKTLVNSGEVIHRYAESGWCEDCVRTPHKQEQEQENAA